MIINISKIHQKCIFLPFSETFVRLYTQDPSTFFPSLKNTKNQFFITFISGRPSAGRACLNITIQPIPRLYLWMVFLKQHWLMKSLIPIQKPAPISQHIGSRVTRMRHPEYGTSALALRFIYFSGAMPKFNFSFNKYERIIRNPWLWGIIVCFGSILILFNLAVGFKNMSSHFGFSAYLFPQTNVYSIICEKNGNTAKRRTRDHNTAHMF